MYATQRLTPLTYAQGLDGRQESGDEEAYNRAQQQIAGEHRADSQERLGCAPRPKTAESPSRRIEKKLFARNIRGFLGMKSPVNKGMEETLKKEPERFFYYNNGVTIICDEAERKSSGGRDILQVANPQVINGQQTTRTLAAQQYRIAATRAELGTRTIFNLLGPLSNPAGVRRQMIGVFSKHWTEPLARVLKNLGAESVWIVHGSDGLDEITTSGPTSVTALESGVIKSFEISPEEVGIAKVKPEALRGGDAESNAKAVEDVLEGKKIPFRDVALLNAAAALVVAGKAKDLKAGLELAAHSVDSGEAEGRLDRLIVVSNNG